MGDALQSEQEPFDIPDVLPLLPVRDLVVFPAQVVPLFVSREISLSAVENALAKERLVFVVAQRDGSEESPQAPEGVFGLGTCCLILRQRKLPDGRIKVLVQGLVKATLEEIRRAAALHPRAAAQDPRAAVRGAGRAGARGGGARAQREDASGEADRHRPRHLARAPARALRRAGPGAARRPLRLQPADEGAGGAGDPRAARSDGAAAAHPRQARARVAAFGDAGAAAETRRRRRWTKTQREYYLREQLRQIQQELGERDEKAEDDRRAARKIRNAGCPPEADEEAGKQLRRLEQMNQDSAEAAVLRTYLEWMVELPWNKLTEDQLDLSDAREILDEDHYGLDEGEGAHPRVPRRAQAQAGTMKGPILCFVGPAGRRQDLARPLASRGRWAASSCASRSAACATRPRSAATGAPTSAPCPAASCRASSRPARRTRSSCSTRSTSSAPTSAATRPRRCWRCSTPSRTTPSATTT